ncbi:MAG TPA: DUF1614 domain-containing protein [Thermoplasmatales archaeon]|nr:DUF1614 domain-containing protein [Thermoplasmatales archaeon]
MNGLHLILAILHLILPIFFLLFIIYIGYLIYTKAFREMGFSSIEAFLIVLISYIFRYPIYINGTDISNIYLFTYDNWIICINVGGALIPIIISLYTAVKKRLSAGKIFVGLLVVTIVSYSVTYPDPTKGIVSRFPYWLLPALFASIISVILYWRDYRRAAPLAYFSGAIGVLIGADFLHLSELLSNVIDKPTMASIGGANIFDMVYITGILAVIIDGMLMFGRKREALGE